MASRDDPFKNAVDKFQRSLTPKERLEFQHCTLQHVEQTIKDLERSLAAKRKQRNMQRISKFVEGMNQLGQVVEVFLNVHATVAFVWGPIKLLLLTASTWVQTLDCLLDKYSEIGEVLPTLTQYRTLLDKHPNLRVHLENYYCDVLEFHRKALDVFSRSNWKIIFHSSWKTFQSHFGGTLAKLKRHQQLLSDETITATVHGVLHLGQSVQSVEDKLDEMSRKLEQLHLGVDENGRFQQKKQLEEKRQFVFSKLNAPDYHTDLEIAFKERGGSDHGDWILSDCTFSNWLELSGSDDSKTLYIHGIPGTGKTILASRITKHLQHMRLSDDRLRVLFFFFKHSDPSKQTAAALFLSILSQLASQDEVVLDSLYERLVALHQQEIRSGSILQELMDMAVGSQQSCFVVIDGLDECVGGPGAQHDHGQKEVVGWIESLSSTGNRNGQRLRILISAQRNGFLENTLGHHPNIRLEKLNAHTADIKAYCEVRSHDIQQKFTLQDNLRADIVSRVWSGADGMFLYAKVVLDNLFRQHSRGHFKRELQGENFPKDLDQAYERVVVRILENSTEGEKEAALRILGLVICSERPLFWKEIQAFFCIDFDTETADPDFQLLGSPKYYCGSLLEATQTDNSTIHASDGSVRIVHETARGYLLFTGRFSMANLQARMALECSKYLASHPFMFQEAFEIRESCNTGYYALIDYAAAYWWKHGKRLLNETTIQDANQPHNSIQAVYQLAQVLRTRKQNKAERHDKAGIEDQMSVRARFTELTSEDPRGWEEAFPIEQHIRPLREFIEQTLNEGCFNTNDMGPYDPGDPQLLYGEITFKCTKPWCSFFPQGFLSAKDRNDHLNQHNRPYRCTIDGCPSRSVGFTTEADLNSHTRQVHPGEGEVELFPSLGSGTTDIFNAVRQRNLPLTRELVHLGTDINKTNTAGQYLLFVAVRSGAYSVCEYLVQAGASVNAANTKTKETPLFAAVAGRRQTIAILLISNGADAFVRSAKEKQLRSLFSDAWTPECEVFKHLPANYHLSEHHHSCRGTDCKIFENALNDEGAIVDDNPAKLQSIIDTSCVSLLGPSFPLLRAFGNAIRKKSNKIVNHILDNNLINVYDTFARPDNNTLLSACEATNRDTCQRLIPFVLSGSYSQLKTTLDDLLSNALAMLVNKGDCSTDKVEISNIRLMLSDLLQAGFPNAMVAARTCLAPEHYFLNGQHAAHRVCHLVDHQELVKLVLSSTDPEVLLQSDYNGFTPLHLAIRWGNIAACKELLQHAPVWNLKTQSNDGESIADAVLLSGSFEVLRWLFSIQTPNLIAELNLLHIAAIKLDADAMRMILDLCPYLLNFGLRAPPASKWNSSLAFSFGKIIRYSLMDSTTNLLTTPLFISMNAIQTLVKVSTMALSNIDASTTGTGRNSKSLRKRFKPVFDVLFSRPIDLYGESSDASRAMQLFLTNHCCDADMVIKMAQVGFQLPWNALVHISSSAYQTSIGTLDLDYRDSSWTLFADVTDTVEAFFSSGKCRVSNIVIENTKLAQSLIKSRFLHRFKFKLDMTQDDDLWEYLDSISDASIIESLLDFGLDRYMMFNGAISNNRSRLVDLLLQTNRFAVDEVLNPGEANRREGHSRRGM
ncbi:hypothetical protein QBC44DRAFT_373441 [Cladorrhinum sp. PSN332]|nr:hypothetical protein QBC44DRAFT_373441 [Cladorrhinum sp. PSN332]